MFVYLGQILYGNQYDAEIYRLKIFDLEIEQSKICVCKRFIRSCFYHGDIGWMHGWMDEWDWMVHVSLTKAAGRFI